MTAADREAGAGHAEAGAPLSFVDLAAQYARLKPAIDARIQAVLDHGQYVMGPEVAELEQALAAFTGARHVVAVSSGTDALRIALLAHGIGPGDAVFLPAFTFPATAGVVALAGAVPVFVDVAPDGYALDPEALERALAASSRRGGPRPRAVIAADLFGLPADYRRLAELARRHDLVLIADAAQSLGARQDGRRVGTLAPVTATSFYPSKPLGAYGDGGALFTDDADLAALMRSLRLHGQGESVYDIRHVGLNARLDSLQAAVLLAKLPAFADELARRAALARFYSERLRAHLHVPVEPEGSQSAWAQYTIEVADRDALRAALARAGIPTAVHYPCPLHLQPAYAHFGPGPGALPVAERLARRVLSLPMHPYLPEETAGHIVDAVLGALLLAAP